MSIRLVELQVALPKSQEIGKINDQLQQRGQLMQDQIVHTRQKEDKRKRKQVLKSDKKEKSALGQKNSPQNTTHKFSTRTETNQQENIKEHPFIGKNIDISG